MHVDTPTRAPKHFSSKVSRSRSGSNAKAKPLKYSRVNALARATPISPDFAANKASTPECVATPREPIVVLGVRSSGNAVPLS